MSAAAGVWAIVEGEAQTALDGVHEAETNRWRATMVAEAGQPPPAAGRARSVGSRTSQKTSVSGHNGVKIAVLAGGDAEGDGSCPSNGIQVRRD
jgi:hypothetical protein